MRISDYVGKWLFAKDNPDHDYNLFVIKKINSFEVMAIVLRDIFNGITNVSMGSVDYCKPVKDDDQKRQLNKIAIKLIFKENNE